MPDTRIPDAPMRRHAPAESAAPLPSTPTSQPGTLPRMEATASSATPRVSVVIPTKNRVRLLFSCLMALSKQTLPADDFDVWIVDDGPDGSTRATVERFAARYPVRFRYLPAPYTEGPAAARNIGWRASTAPIVAFTDDDTLPEPDWLERGLAAFKSDTAGVAGGIAMPLPEHPTDYELDATRLADSEFVTANVFYRRAALEAVGGFDERFKAAWREDADLQFSLTEHGYRLDHAPDALVIHPVRPAGWGVALQQQSKVQYNPLLYKKHPALYREKIGHSPRWYYAAVGTGALAVFGLLTGRRRAARLSALAWGAMTLAFTGKRLSRTSKAPQHIAEMLVTSALIPFLSVFFRAKGMLRYRAPFW